MLRHDWKIILRRAWSIRLMLVAGLLTGCEAVLPLYIDAIPRGAYAVLSSLVIAAAMVARLMAQRGVSDV